MREIKFRVWDHGCKEFVDDMCLHVDGKLLCDCGRTGYCGDFTVQQYTGLKDKNEREIYEGDIVRIICGKDELVGTVQWDYLNAAFLVGGTSGIYGPEQSVEVIRNIFENPELIKTEV